MIEMNPKSIYRPRAQMLISNIIFNVEVALQIDCFDVMCKSSISFIHGHCPTRIRQIVRRREKTTGHFV